jgi:hypothetical protein
MRLKLVSVLAVFMVMLAGSAWADEAGVVTAITSYGLSRQGGENGDTITVEGSKLDATSQLDLGDISDLTINWKAKITREVSTVSPGKDHIQLINVWGTGTFNIESEAELKVPGTENNMRHVYLIRALEGGPSGSESVTINVNGGTLEAIMPNATAIDDDNFDHPPIIKINGGTINVPDGNAAVGNVTVINAANVTGTVIDKNSIWSNWSVELYGNCSVQTIFEDDEKDEMNIRNISWRIMPSATATVKAGTTWSIRDSWTLQNDGTLDIYGTLINFDKFINEGTINNYSGNTVDNRGRWINRSTINNKASGKIRRPALLTTTAA